MCVYDKPAAPACTQCADNIGGRVDATTIGCVGLFHMNPGRGNPGDSVLKVNRLGGFWPGNTLKAGSQFMSTNCFPLHQFTKLLDRDIEAMSQSTRCNQAKMYT